MDPYPYPFVHKMGAYLKEGLAPHVLATMLIIGLISTFEWLIRRTKYGPGYREAEAHLKRAKALQEADRFVEARQEIDRSIVLLEDRRRSRLLAEAYLRLGDIDVNLKQWESAIHHYTLAKEESITAKKTSMLDMIYLRLGVACKMGGDLNQACAWIDQARMLQERTQDNPLLGETYEKLGEIDARRGLFDTAINYYLRSLAYQERIRDRRSQAGIHASLGDLYARKQMAKEARDHYQAARELYEQVGDATVAALLVQKAS
jgi:tetratricopeptide (TPR) repeat protein